MISLPNVLETFGSDGSWVGSFMHTGAQGELGVTWSAGACCATSTAIQRPRRMAMLDQFSKEREESFLVDDEAAPLEELCANSKLVAWPRRCHSSKYMPGQKICLSFSWEAIGIKPRTELMNCLIFATCSYTSDG